MGMNEVNGGHIGCFIGGHSSGHCMQITCCIHPQGLDLGRITLQSRFNIMCIFLLVAKAMKFITLRKNTQPLVL